MKKDKHPLEALWNTDEDARQRIRPVLVSAIGSLAATLGKTPLECAVSDIFGTRMLASYASQNFSIEDFREANALHGDLAWQWTALNERHTRAILHGRSEGHTAHWWGVVMAGMVQDFALAMLEEEFGRDAIIEAIKVRWPNLYSAE